MKKIFILTTALLATATVLNSCEILSMSGIFEIETDVRAEESLIYTDSESNTQKEEETLGKGDLTAEADGSSKGLEFSFDVQKGGYVLKDIGTCTDRDIVITTYDGYPVIAIDAYSMGSLAATVKTVTLGEHISSISSTFFNNTKKLTEIRVDGNNANYFALDGNLYSKDGKTLVKYLSAKNERSFSIPDSVETISEYAFERCGVLAFLRIGKGLKKLNSLSIYSCGELEGITVDERNEYFKSEDGVLFSKDGSILYVYPTTKRGVSYDVPDGVCEIYSYAFEGALFLENVSLPDSVTEIGYRAFYECGALTEAALGEGLEKLYGYCFYKCEKLTSIHLPDSLTYLDSSSFSGCTALTSVEFGRGVTYVGMSAFAGCKSLVEIDLPEGLTFIAPKVFDGCAALKKVTVPSTVKEIGRDAFAQCYDIEEVYISDISAWLKMDIDGTYSGPLKSDTVLYLNGELLCELVIPLDIEAIKDNAFAYCQSITSVTLGDNVKSIGEHAFFRCGNLVNVNIGKNVTQINETAFKYCESLENIAVHSENATYSSMDGNLYDKPRETLLQYAAGKSDTSFTVPEGVRYVSSYAFSGASNLKSVVLNDSMTSVADLLFISCYNLEELTVGESVTSIGRVLFATDTPKITLKYNGTQQMWQNIDKASGWSDNVEILEIIYLK